jgi:hypothetical protein
LAKAKTPDESELIAQQFLLHSGHCSVDYEPCGRDTAPDFLVDGQIAVEVRRLNQNFVSRDGLVEGVEQQWRNIWNKLGTLAISFKTPIEGESWFLFINHFRRPVADWNILKPRIRYELTNFMNQPVRSACTIRLNRNFAISLHPAGRLFPTFFVLGAGHDFDAGGWVVAEMMENIHLCIREKAGLIDRSKYNEWWLILIDRTGLGFSKDDHDSLLELMSQEYAFDRIMLINPRDHTHALRLHPAS